MAQTMTYVQRLRDVWPLLESDLRLQVAFTVAPHALGDGAAEFLTSLGISVTPWERAVGERFDLALAAGSQGIQQVRAPVVRLPHGASHIKAVRQRDSSGTRTVSRGVSRPYLTWKGKVVPAAVVLAHEEDREELSRSCPEALPVAEVVGDPCHDRIIASLPLREEYRRRLGLRDGQKLVLVSSTWGSQSSFGSIDALLPRIIGELPRDRYRTVVMVHPNVWARHGTWQVRAWLAVCRRHGIGVVDPHADWRSLLVAADVIIGDHGSVTLYGTLTEAAILLARYPYREVNPLTPTAALALAVPALSPSPSLAEQVEYALTEYRREDHAAIATRLTSEPGRFNRNMRRLMYRLMGIGQPASEPVTDPVPPPPRLDNGPVSLMDLPA